MILMIGGFVILYHIYVLQDAKTRVGETISLPRVVFPSNEEEEVGLLNKAAPRLFKNQFWTLKQLRLRRKMSACKITLQKAKIVLRTKVHDEPQKPS